MYTSYNLIEAGKIREKARVNAQARFAASMKELRGLECYKITQNLSVKTTESIFRDPCT